MPNSFIKVVKIAGFLFALGLVTQQAFAYKKNKLSSIDNSKISTKPNQRSPYLAASIVVKVYEKGKFIGIVLIERGRHPIGHALPGGFIRIKETAEACAKRTLLDECGILTVSNLKQFLVYSTPNRDPRYHVVDTIFTARVDDIQLCAGTDAKHAYICPIDKIPWDKLAFDHKEILKDFLGTEISKNDQIQNCEKLAETTHALKERVLRDRKELLESKIEPLFLAASVITEVYEKGIFKGIVLIDRRKPPFGKAIPGGHVEYGETVDYTAKRAMREKCHLDIKELLQFKVYSDPSRDSRKRKIDVIHIARVDDAIPVGDSDAMSARIYPIDKLPMEEMAFDHKQILQDYLAYKNGNFSNTLVQCIQNLYVEKSSLCSFKRFFLLR